MTVQGKNLKDAAMKLISQGKAKEVADVIAKLKDQVKISDEDNPSPEEKDMAESVKARVNLEKTLEKTLREDISRIEEGLQIIDEGMKKRVEEGSVDITCRDVQGNIVVIVLSVLSAGAEAVARVLSLMGAVSAEDNSQARGILISGEFSRGAVNAASVVMGLDLITCSLDFKFARVR